MDLRRADVVKLFGLFLGCLVLRPTVATDFWVAWSWKRRMSRVYETGESYQRRHASVSQLCNSRVFQRAFWPLMTARVLAHYRALFRGL